MSLPHERSRRFFGEVSRAEQLGATFIADGRDEVLTAKKLGVKLAWGTDFLFEPGLTMEQNRYLLKLQDWFTPAEILRLAIHDNAQLLALSGKRNPYPGKLGVVEVGALAE